jgi:hypothetical protein
LSKWQRQTGNAATSSATSTKVREIAAMLNPIRAGEDIVAALQEAAQVIEKIQMPSQEPIVRKLTYGRYARLPGLTSIGDFKEL